MIFSKVAAKKNITEDASQKYGRALSLLLDDMSVWFPDSYVNVEAMIFEETKGFMKNRKQKNHASVLTTKKDKKPLGGCNNVSLRAL